MLEDKPVEEKKEKVFKGFAEGRSKWYINKRYVR
jgi:hypothetical protein